MEPGKGFRTIYRKKEECCGCAACCSICPRQAVSMIPDEEGFLYAVIDESKCVRCDLCVRVCPVYRDPDVPERTESGEEAKRPG